MTHRIVPKRAKSPPGTAGAKPSSGSTRLAHRKSEKIIPRSVLSSKNGGGASSNVSQKLAAPPAQPMSSAMLQARTSPKPLPKPPQKVSSPPAMANAGRTNAHPATQAPPPGPSLTPSVQPGSTATTPSASAAPKAAAPAVTKAISATAQEKAFARTAFSALEDLLEHLRSRRGDEQIRSLTCDNGDIQSLQANFSRDEKRLLAIPPELENAISLAHAHAPKALRDKDFKNMPDIDYRDLKKQPATVAELRQVLRTIAPVLQAIATS